MSLKAFHILFVTASTLLAAGVAFWAFQQTPGDDLAWLGFGSVAAVVVLPVYGVWFLRKTREVSFL
jgi:high-affinity Fe2+/Pb2+ permease